MYINSQVKIDNNIYTITHITESNNVNEYLFFLNQIEFIVVLKDEEVLEDGSTLTKYNRAKIPINKNYLRSSKLKNLAI